TGNQFVVHGGLVVFLVGCGFQVHRPSFSVTLLEDDFGFRLALSADRTGMAFRFHRQALPFSFGQRLNPLALDFCPLQYGGYQFLLATQDFGLLHLHLLLFFDLLDLHSLGGHLLLHDIGLDLVRFVGLRLLAFYQFVVGRFLHFEIALRLGLPRQGSRFSRDALLVGLRLGDGRFPQRNGAPDGGGAFRFGGGDVGVALDARHVWPPHVGDVLVLVTHFLDGERNHLDSHLVHVVGTGGAHPIGDHFGLL